LFIDIVVLLPNDAADDGTAGWPAQAVTWRHLGSIVVTPLRAHSCA